MAKWKYLILSIELSEKSSNWTLKLSDMEYIGVKNIQEYLDYLGYHEWELVSAIPCNDNGSTYCWELFFRKRIGEDEVPGKQVVVNEQRSNIGIGLGLGFNLDI